jgi:hypothetical protein
VKRVCAGMLYACKGVHILTDVDTTDVCDTVFTGLRERERERERERGMEREKEKDRDRDRDMLE